MISRHTIAGTLMCVATLLTTSACSGQADRSSTTGQPATQELETAAPEPGADPPADDPALARAKAAAQAFSADLRRTLQAAMQAGGPTAAVAVCQSQAPRIAEQVAAEHGVRLGRVALPGRHRNPAQAASDWQLATLERFNQRVLDGEAAADQVAVIREHLPDDVSLRMMRGIATEPGCLACHGSAPAADVRDIIARHYPDDGATGFHVGDLRGALWVEVPATGR